VDNAFGDHVRLAEAASIDPAGPAGVMDALAAAALARALGFEADVVERGLAAHKVGPHRGALVGRVLELDETPDLVNVFRAPQYVPAHTDEILAMQPRPKAVWLQLGIHDDASARRLEAAGIAVVQDRCIMVEHRRLVGS